MNAASEVLRCCLLAVVAVEAELLSCLCQNVTVETKVREAAVFPNE